MILPMVKNAHNKPIAAEYLASLPSFCMAIFQNGDPHRAPWIDFWAVEPSGDSSADYACGDRLGVEALEHARKTGEPKFVDCVILWMNFVFRSEGKELGPLEHGFLHRVLRDDVQLADRLLAQISSAHPGLRN
jgi:hypothetical protein